jgi:hypothetical protein
MSQCGSYVNLRAAIGLARAADLGQDFRVAGSQPLSEEDLARLRTPIFGGQKKLERLVCFVDTARMKRSL